MVETLRKKTRKSFIVRAVITLVVAASLLVFTKFAIFDVLTGASRLDITRDLATYEGKYVRMDVDFFLTDYVEHTTTTTRRYGGSSTVTNGNSYIAYQVAQSADGGESTLYFFSVYMGQEDARLMEQKMEQSWEQIGNGGARTASAKPSEVIGTWTEMDSQIERYFRETLAEMGISESKYDRFCFYTLDTGKIGGQSTILFWVMMAVALVCLIIFVLSLVGCFTDGYLSNINKYLRLKPSASLEAIEADFAQAHAVGSDTWVGRTWTIYRRGSKAYILQNQDLVWGYYFRRTGRNSVSEMRLYTIDKKIEHVSLSESETKEALGYYVAEQPHMMIGYNADYEKMWQKDFSGFLEMRYNPAMRNAPNAGNRTT